MAEINPTHRAYSPRAELLRIIGGATVAVAFSVTLMGTTPAYATEAVATTTPAETQSVVATEDAATEQKEAVVPEADGVTAAALADTGEIDTKDSAASTKIEPPTQSDVDSTPGNNLDVVDEDMADSSAIQQSAIADNADHDDADDNIGNATAGTVSDTVAAGEASSAAERPSVVQQLAPAKVTAAPYAQEQTTLDGIDISRSQGDIDLSEVSGDFVIVKATEGADSTSRTFAGQAKGALDSGKLLGLYHFMTDDATAEAQADWFAETVKPYIGKALLFLDWEDADYSNVTSLGTDFAKVWLDRVYVLTGVRPLIYMDRSMARDYDWSAVAADYKLWGAQYADMAAHHGYQDDPWRGTDNNWGAWSDEGPTILQYSSNTYLDGYEQNLDVDKFYGSRDDWANMAGVRQTLAEQHRGDVADGTYLIRTALDGGSVLDVANGSKLSGGNVQLYQSDGTDAQRWVVSHDSEGYVILTNVGSGKALDATDGRAVSGTNVQQWKVDGTPAQRWIFIRDAATGLFKIVSGLDTNLVLDVTSAQTTNGTNIQIYRDNGTKAQRFVLTLIESAQDDQGMSLPDEGIYELQTALEGSKDIEVSGGSSYNGGRVQTYWTNDTPAQRWRLVRNGSDDYTFINVNSGKAMDVTNASVKNQASIQQYESNGTYAQRWKLVSDTAHPGYFVIQSVLDPSFVLDIAGANTNAGVQLQLYTANGTLAQLFRLQQILQVVQDGVYTIQNAGSGNNLDVSGASLDAGGNVQQYAGNGTMAQDFQVTYDTSNGYYQFVNVQSGRSLDVANGSTSNGGNVQQYDANGTLAQLWAIKRNADGTLTITSAKSGLAIDVASGSHDSGANVQIYASNGTAAQKWVFARNDDWLREGTYRIVSEVNHDNVVMVAKSSVANSAPLYMRVVEAGQTSQEWQLVKVGEYYKFINVGSGLAIDVRSASAANGTAVQQYQDNGTDAQLWSVVLASNGFKLVSKLSNHYVIDLPSALPYSFVNLQLYTDNGTNAQRWHLVSVSPFSGREYELVAQSEGVYALNGADTVSYGTGIAGEADYAGSYTLESLGGSKYRIRTDGGYLAAASDGTLSVAASGSLWTIGYNTDAQAYGIMTADGRALGVHGGKLALVEKPQDVALGLHTKQTRQDYFINTAADELGNGGYKYWTAYWGDSYHWVNGYTTPYCACFASWVSAQTGIRCAGLPAASCTAIYRAARAAGRVVPKREAQRGDLVIYDWGNDGVLDHVGIVESNRGDAGITTVEGNTTNHTGECVVASQNRPWDEVAYIIRPYF